MRLAKLLAVQWGRNGEGGTEDPYLMGEYAAAYTRGFQFQGKNSSKYLTAILTLKHYVANSVDNTRINRTSHTDGQIYTKGTTISRHTMDVTISNAQLQGANIWQCFRSKCSLQVRWQSTWQHFGQPRVQGRAA